MMTKKSERLYLRVSAEDKDYIKFLAKANNMKISQFVVYCIAMWLTCGDKEND